MTDREPEDPKTKLVRNEGTKLTATYINAGAGALFTAGVVAPIAAAVFGVGTAAGVSALTLGVGILMFLTGSVALHAAARYALKRLKP